MKSLETIKRTLFEIAQTLSQNTYLQQLLIEDNNDIQKGNPTFTIHSINDLMDEQYICLDAHLENGIVNHGRNSFIIIHLDSMSFKQSSNNIPVYGSIYIATDKNHVMLTENRQRLWEMIDEIYKTIDGKKFSAAGILEIKNVSSVIYSEYSFGYRISFEFKEQEQRKAVL